jgi:hypothetical protein
MKYVAHIPAIIALKFVILSILTAPVSTIIIPRTIEYKAVAANFEVLHGSPD